MILYIHTLYIFLVRYKKLLQDILKLDIAYIPISSNISGEAKIDPQCFSYTLRGMPCIGGAISKDIKHSIIPFLDRVDEFAERIGSVNTVIVKNGLLVGYNTDYIGFKEAITAGIRKSGIEVKTAVCYGYGGVASVVTNALKDLNIEVYLIGRSNETAEARANELKVHYWNNQKCDLFVNATPASGK
jgi:shikimate 5-dehydrogenase